MAASASFAFVPSGPPACAMSGRPPPPLPPSASDARAHEIDRADARGQILGDADDERGAAFGDGDERDDARADLRLRIVGERLQILGGDVLDDAQHGLDPGDLARCVAAALATGRRARAPCARPRVRVRAGGVPRRGRRCGRAIPRARSSARRRPARAASAWPSSQRRAPSEVSASMRRTPAATADSASTVKRPISPRRRTCVPPQSSTE